MTDFVKTLLENLLKNNIDGFTDTFYLMTASVILVNIIFLSSIGYACASCCGNKHPTGFQLLYYSVALCIFGMNIFSSSYIGSTFVKATAEHASSTSDSAAGILLAVKVLSAISTFSIVAIAVASVITLGAIGFTIYMMMKPNQPPMVNQYNQVIEDPQAMTVGMWVYVGLVVAISIVNVVCFSMIAHKMNKIKKFIQSAVFLDAYLFAIRSGNFDKAVFDAGMAENQTTSVSSRY